MSMPDFTKRAIPLADQVRELAANSIAAFAAAEITNTSLATTWRNNARDVYHFDLEIMVREQKQKMTGTIDGRIPTYEAGGYISGSSGGRVRAELKKESVSLAQSHEVVTSLVVPFKQLEAVPAQAQRLNAARQAFLQRNKL